MYKVVFVRHGKTPWAEKFTGWTDVEVTPEGLEQTKQYAPRLKEAGFQFDIAFTSYLKRAIKTLWTVLETIDQMNVSIVTAWQLNERDYGALKGLNKAETAAKYGEAQVEKWRRDFNERPPFLTQDDPRWPGHESKYRHLNSADIPCGESTADTFKRAVPYWENEIVPEIKKGKQVLISASHNSMRAICMHVEKMTEEQIIKFNIAYSIPLVYEFDDDMNFIKRYYLATDEEVEKIIQEIKNQGKKKG